MAWSGGENGEWIPDQPASPSLWDAISNNSGGGGSGWSATPPPPVAPSLATLPAFMQPGAAATTNKAATAPVYGVSLQDILKSGLGSPGGLSTDGGGGESYLEDPNGGMGYWAMPEYGAGSYQGEDNYTPGALGGYRVYRNIDGYNKSTLGASKVSRYNGTKYDKYDKDGNYLGADTWKELGGGPTPAVGVAMMLGGIGATMMGAGAAGAAGGGASAGGPGSAGWGMDLGMGGLGGDTFATGAGGLGGGGGAMNGLNGADIMSDAFVSNGGYGAGGFGGGNGSWLSSLGSSLGSGGSSSLQNQLIKSGLSSALNGGGGGGGSGGNGGFDLGSLIAGGADYYGQNKASGELLKWLKERTAITDNLYKPGSPEHNLMQQEMERKDAAAGRNSQYGTRAIDLAAKIAQIKAAENTKMTVGVGNLMKEGFDQRASAPAGLMAALGGQNGGAGLQNLSSLLGGSSSGTNSSWYDSLFGIGQDGSNAPGGVNFGSDIGADDWDTWAGLL